MFNLSSQGNLIGIISDSGPTGNDCVYVADLLRSVKGFFGYLYNWTISLGLSLHSEAS